MRPFLKTTYIFQFNKPNVRLVDLKMTILKAPEVSNTELSKFGKKDNLRLHIRVYADLFVIRFSRLRPFFISPYNLRVNEPNFCHVDLKLTIVL